MAPTETIVGIAEAVRSGARSAEETTRACLDRIEARDPAIHAFLSTDRCQAITRAREINARVARGANPGPLCGVPLAVKDNICTAFGPTTCGSKMLEPFHSS